MATLELSKESVGRRPDELGGGLQHHTPVSLVRDLMALSKAHGSNAMAYHFAPSFESLQTTQPYLYFESGRAVSRNKISDQHKQGIGRAHDQIIKDGRPIALSTLIPFYRKIAEKPTNEVWDFIRAQGVEDYYFVPVFGPFRTNAVISFGFPVATHEIDSKALAELVQASIISHNEIVRYFGKAEDTVVLSEREKSVLKWIAKGKSTTDIATILDIQRSSVDTYTRRIFKKLGVNDRISASMQALKEGMIDF